MTGSPTSRRFPVLWQLNARTTVRRIDPQATLDDLDHDTLDRLVPPGVDWLYLLGVWQTGAAGRAVSRQDPDIRRSCEEALPDLHDDDICGSCFAIADDHVHEQLGGDVALERLRLRLAERDTSLMIDFVPNHTAPDHPWVQQHPEYYVEGTEDDLASHPENWIRIATTGGEERILAHGRDPFFAGWPDTLQLDYSSDAVRAAMTDRLLGAARHADGLRCDMAMLLLPDVFERTWGRPTSPFRPDAIRRVRSELPDVTFMAEVYWDREFDLQQQGFDFTYDKRLYDRLAGDVGEVRAHLGAAADFTARSARFLENHDEPRAAATFGVGDRHRAAATISYLVPGLRFFQRGQPDGNRIHVPMHLCRGPDEPQRDELLRFYRDLLELLQEPSVHNGVWSLAEVRSAWSGNDSHHRVVAFTWSTDEGELRHIGIVNLAEDRSQGYVQLGFDSLTDRHVVLIDRLGDETYERDGGDLVSSGLYIDVAPWAHHLFELSG